MRTAEEILKEKTNMIFTYQQLDSWKEMLCSAMHQYAKEILQEAANRMNYSHKIADGIYIQIDAEKILNLINELL